jgi:hypothetical protein
LRLCGCPALFNEGCSSSSYSINLPHSVLLYV